MTGSTAMKTAHRVSLFLIAVSLLAMLWSSVPMIAFVDYERLYSTSGTRVAGFETFMHEAGFARLTLAVIGLLILFIPYRKGEAWALAALAVLMICYVLPVGFFLSMTHLDRWLILREFSTGPRLLGLAGVDFVRHFFPGLAFAGLAIAVPYLITSRRNARLKDIQTP
jgi:cell division protein FtsW (lipid II flippase)